MIHGSLFSGVGGFDLAAQWMGWENAFHCEINPFCQTILKHYWPNAASYTDIKQTDFSIHRGTVDIVTGGFPCQPFSLAGKRKGTDDARYLWPEMLRAIREIQPQWVVGENVYGLVNWDGGMVFDKVCADLEAEGYEVQPVILPACSKDAPHKRERIWFIAHAQNIGHQCREDDHRRDAGKLYTGERSRNETDGSEFVGCGGVITDANSCPERAICGDEAHNRGVYTKNTDNSNIGRDGDAANAKEQRLQERDAEQAQHRTHPTVKRHGSVPCWQDFPTQSPVRRRDDGLSRELYRYINSDYAAAISKTSEENRIKDLPEVWNLIQQEEIWGSIRRFYSLESKDVLLKTVQLYSTCSISQSDISPFSKKFSEPLLRHLQKHTEFRRSPQGRRLDKQRSKQFGDTLSFLPHEVALAAKAHEKRLLLFDTWHRTESIKGFGNAIVPQMALEIFRIIDLMSKAA